MQKIFIEFKFIINEKEYRISCEPNSPFADCKESALQFLKQIGAMEDNAKAQQEIKQEEKKSEEVLNGQ